MAKFTDNILSFVVLYGLLCFFSWSLYTVTLSQLQNLERAFGLTSSESGWLLTVWEMGYVSFCVIASYFGARAHAPRVIGIATLLNALSAIIFALPHFVAYKDANTGVTTENSTSDDMKNIDLCVIGDMNRTTRVDTAESEAENVANLSRKNLAYALLCLGMIVQGISKSPCYPYSAQYVDDNGDKQKTGFYIGVMASIAIFGLVLGYGVGSGVSNVYVTLKSTNLEPTDTRFIGAWWLGMIGISVTIFIISVPMFFFPRRMKSSHHVTEHPHTYNPKTPHFKKEMKRVLTTLLKIIKSPVYTITLAGTCLQTLSFACFMTFEPKYMATEFYMDPWKVNIILGVCSILAYSVGCLIGGFITKKWKMTPYRNILVIIILLVIVCVFIAINMFIGCSQPDIYNIPTSIDGVSVSQDCDCSSTEFTPICGDDDNAYFSPCHAGCLNGTSKIFSNCSAIPGGGANIGLCDSGCTMVWPYSAVKFLMNTVDAVSSIPTFLVLLRSAGEEHKSLALGLSAALQALCGYLPGPVVSGKIVDSTCIFWSTASTSTKYCSFYDIDALRLKLHGNMLGIRVASILMMCLALYKARNLEHWDATTEDKEMDVMETEEQLMVQQGEKVN